MMFWITSNGLQTNEIRELWPYMVWCVWKNAEQIKLFANVIVHLISTISLLSTLFASVLSQMFLNCIRIYLARVVIHNLYCNCKSARGVNEKHSRHFLFSSFISRGNRFNDDFHSMYMYTIVHLAPTACSWPTQKKKFSVCSGDKVWNSNI